MYENFADYWAAKKDILTKLGVNESTARMIFTDAALCISLALAESLLKKS